MSTHTSKQQATTQHYNQYDESSSSHTESYDNNRIPEFDPLPRTPTLSFSQLPKRWINMFTLDIAGINRYLSSYATYVEVESIKTKHDANVPVKELEAFDQVVTQFQQMSNEQCLEYIRRVTNVDYTLFQKTADFMHALKTKDLTVISADFKSCYSTEQMISKWFINTNAQGFDLHERVLAEAFPFFLDSLADLLQQRVNAEVRKLIEDNREKSFSFTKDYFFKQTIDFEKVVSDKRIGSGSFRSSYISPFSSPPNPSTSRTKHNDLLVGLFLSDICDIIMLVPHDKSVGSTRRLHYKSDFFNGTTFEERTFVAPIYIATEGNFSEAKYNTILELDQLDVEPTEESIYFATLPTPTVYYANTQMTRSSGPHDTESLYAAAFNHTIPALLEMDLKTPELLEGITEYNFSDAIQGVLDSKWPIEIHGEHYYSFRNTASILNDLDVTKIHLLSFSTLNTFSEERPHQSSLFSFYLLSFCSQTILAIPKKWITNSLYLVDKRQHPYAFRLSKANYAKMPRFCSSFYLAMIMSMHETQVPEHDRVLEHMKSINQGFKIKRNRKKNLSFTEKKFDRLFEKAWFMEYMCGRLYIVGPEKFDTPEIDSVCTALYELDEDYVEEDTEIIQKGKSGEEEGGYSRKSNGFRFAPTVTFSSASLSKDEVVDEQPKVIVEEDTVQEPTDETVEVTGGGHEQNMGKTPPT